MNHLPQKPCQIIDNKRQSACKPGSVWPRHQKTAQRGGHSSGTDVAARLVQPTRTAGRKLPEGCPSRRPYSVLLPMGFTVPPLLPVARWALTPPFHPYPANSPAVLNAGQQAGWFAFCGTIPEVALAGR